MIKTIVIVFAYLAGMSVCFVAGCDRKPTAPRSDAKEFSVAILGDTTRCDLLRSIASSTGSEVHEDGMSLAVDVQEGGRTYHFRTTRDETTTAHARLAWEADLMLIAVNATKGGPVPIHREHVQLAGPMSVPDISVAFTNSRQIRDPELLELEELEMRELLDAYGMGGDDALCALDDAEAQTSTIGCSIRGPLQIVRSLAPIIQKRALDTHSWESQRVLAEVRVLQREAVFPPEIAITIQKGPAVVLMRGKEHHVEVVTSTRINPGGVGEVEFVFEESVPFAKMQRFAVLNKGHIAATGVFMVNRNR